MAGPLELWLDLSIGSDCKTCGSVENCILSISTSLVKLGGVEIARSVLFYSFFLRNSRWQALCWTPLTGIWFDRVVRSSMGEDNVLMVLHRREWNLDRGPILWFPSSQPIQGAHAGMACSWPVWSWFCASRLLELVTSKCWERWCHQVFFPVHHFCILSWLHSDQPGFKPDCSRGSDQSFLVVVHRWGNLWKLRTLRSQRLSQKKEATIPLSEETVKTFQHRQSRLCWRENGYLPISVFLLCSFLFVSLYCNFQAP